MGLMKGCSLRKKKSSENCYDPNPCECEDDDEQMCNGDGSDDKQACCKPGCSPKKPCVSCIKCGVRPEVCSRPPRRTCVLPKSCCKEAATPQCPKESMRERIIRIKSKCVIQKDEEDYDCDDERDLDVKITINGNDYCGSETKCYEPKQENSCCESKPKPCCPKPEPKCPKTPCESKQETSCQKSKCKQSCTKTQSCEDPCPKQKAYRPPTPPASSRKVMPCTCNDCNASVRFKKEKEIIPSCGDGNEKKKCKKSECTPPNPCKKPDCQKPQCRSPECTPVNPCCKPTCQKPQCCAKEKGNTATFYMAEAVGNFQPFMPPQPPICMPNMTKCWSNPVPCPCGAHNCPNAMIIYP